MSKKKLLNRQWVITNKLSGKELQSLIILATAANIQVDSSIKEDLSYIGRVSEMERKYYYLGYDSYKHEEGVETYSGILLIQIGVAAKDIEVSYKEVIKALTKEIEKNAR